MGGALLRRSGDRRSGAFYKSVGRVGRTFIEIEAEAFKLPRERRATLASHHDRRNGDEQTEKKTQGVDRRAFPARGRDGAAVVPRRRIAGDRGAEPARAAESDQERKKARYRETEHVKAYYRMNGYET